MRPQRKHHGVVVGRRLQFKIEAPTKFLAQSQTERPIDASAQGRMHHQLHAPGFIEEALEDEFIRGGQASKSRQ